jgi:amino acid permease
LVVPASRKQQPMLVRMLAYVVRPTHLQFNVVQLIMGFTRPGGVRATVFNLLNATAGAAVIAMPEAVRASGLAFSFIQLVMACLVNYVSSSTLLYTSFEWGLFSYSELSANCHGKLYSKFVDLFYFVNVFGTTLSYSVLVQGNLVTSFGFIRSKYWQEMPPILDDPNSIFWVIFFAVNRPLHRLLYCHS